MTTERPAFQSLEKSGEFELRLYTPMIVAETTVEGSLDRATNTGFRLIAGYIFGDNRTQAGSSGEKIAMTAPVTVEAASQKIDMTAPVLVQGDAERWHVSFVMPSRYRLATLPLPNNPRVTLREIPERKAAAISFSGYAGEAKVKTKTEALSAWMAARGLEPLGSPQLARYDPPWTLPFLRHNEILIACR